MCQKLLFESMEQTFSGYAAAIKPCDTENVFGGMRICRCKVKYTKSSTASFGHKMCAVSFKIT